MRTVSRIFSTIIAGFLACVLCVQTAGATASTSQVFNVGFSVGSSGGSSPGPGGSVSPGNGNSNAAPVISNVIASVTANSATISWQASDSDGTVAGVAIHYGKTASFGSSGTVTGGYTATLSGLTSATTYYFEITATDNSGANGTYDGSFITASASAAFTLTNVVVVPGISSATISWQTSAPANTVAVYGISTNYGSTASNAALVTDHTTTLLNLLPNTTYHFLPSSADGNGLTIFGTDTVFATTADVTPPPDVSNFAGNPGVGKVDLSWHNPDPALTPDFAGVRIIRKAGSQHPQTVSDGLEVYAGNNEAFSDRSVVANTTYSYTAFSYDTSGNVSGGTWVEGVTVPATPPAPVEICNNGVDDDNNGQTDCADAACATDSSCKPQPKAEICNNGIDDDGNGLTDCADAACVGFSACVGNEKPPEIVVPPSTVGGGEKLRLDQLRFFTGNRNIQLTLVGGGVSLLAGAPLSVAVAGASLPHAPTSLVLIIDGGSEHAFALSIADNTYYADVSVPAVGAHSAYVLIRYADGSVDSIPFVLTSAPWGDVVADGANVPGVTITLQDASGAVFSLAAFGEQNPFVASVNGNYGFMVPNGTYRVVIVKTGYYERTSPPITVTNNILNTTITVVAVPKSIVDILDPTKTVAENSVAVAKAIGSRTKAVVQQVVQVVADLKANPEATKVAGDVVAPTVVGAAAVGVFSFASFGNILQLLRLLFLQPVLLVGRRKRQGWGQVYDALSKLPVDLATLRLVNADTGVVVQTKVTDSKGRYAFVAQPGRYRIDAAKGDLTFPSRYLQGFKDDGRKTDIYHGEIITVDDKDVVITVNIPLDPTRDASVPVRLRLQQFTRALKIGVSLFGLLVTVFTLYLSPKWYVWGLLGLHIIFLAIFRRLAIPPKIKSWGIVYEDRSKKPIGRTIARLFNAQFNKLVATQITDAKGRYYFLAGDNRYYVTYEHPDYESLKGVSVDLSGKDAEAIASDVQLKKKTAGAPPSVPPAFPSDRSATPPTSPNEASPR